jgi:hypothetical protein
MESLNNLIKLLKKNSAEVETYTWVIQGDPIAGSSTIINDLYIPIKKHAVFIEKEYEEYKIQIYPLAIIKKQVMNSFDSEMKMREKHIIAEISTEYFPKYISEIAKIYDSIKEIAKEKNYRLEKTHEKESKLIEKENQREEKRELDDLLRKII